MKNLQLATKKIIFVVAIVVALAITWISFQMMGEGEPNVPFHLFLFFLDIAVVCFAIYVWYLIHGDKNNL